jgi:hypothetical protein
MLHPIFSQLGQKVVSIRCVLEHSSGTALIEFKSLGANMDDPTVDYWMVVLGPRNTRHEKKKASFHISFWLMIALTPFWMPVTTWSLMQVRRIIPLVSVFYVPLE